MASTAARSALLLTAGLLLTLCPLAQAQTPPGGKALFILSAHEHGYWLPEVLTP